VLIWTRGDITYRLESSLALDEAVKVAESLRPLGADVPIPPDLERARPLVQWLGNAGIAVRSVDHSVEGALFDSAVQAAVIRTELGSADVVFFEDSAESDRIQVTPLSSADPARYLYRIEGPITTMLQPRTIDAAFPLYFQVGNGMFIDTSSAELARALQGMTGQTLPASP
jgi:hypothetical protein